MKQWSISKKRIRLFRAQLAEMKKEWQSEIENHSISDRMADLRAREGQGVPLCELLPETFACVYSSARETLGLVPHDAQLLTALAMAHGCIAELPTGEGKTLAAVFTASLAALSGRGVHVLTFNDYLARRDATWMQPVYERLGFTVSFIQEGMTHERRKAAYNADITYLTAKEAGFDYLRSFLEFDPAELVQRPFYWAVVDEADSIMIDEARIPLVAAGDRPSAVQIDEQINSAVASLQKGEHFTVDECVGTVSLTEAGAARLEQKLGVKNLYGVSENELLAQINMSLQAHFLLHRDSDYIVRDGQVFPVDEFTGRIVKNREWPVGLQAAVELKEGLVPGEHGTVMNRVTLRDFLGFYSHLCGMTGTACSAAEEFGEFYGLPVAVIPPDRPCIRCDQPDAVFADIKAKNEAVATEIRRAHMVGRPVLVGTRTVEESETLASMLSDIPGLAVLNAKNDLQEAEIIAHAGRQGAVTISTNMAGRGVDIRLGGGDKDEYRRVCKLGGLYVIGTNHYESMRIDRQLRGRAGRQGDPGESRFFVSVQDDLMVKYRLSDYLPRRVRKAGGQEPLHSAVLGRAISHIQHVSEGQLSDIKITLAKYSAVVEEQRKIVYKKRMDILTDDASLGILEKQNPKKRDEILHQISQEEYVHARKCIELFAINVCWANHLLECENAMDEVPVIGQAHGDPFLTFNRRIIAAFDNMEQIMTQMVLDSFSRLIIRDGKVDLLAMGIHGPSSTRTYLVSDGTENYGMSVRADFASAVNPTLYLLLICAKLFHLRKDKSNSKNRSSGNG